MPSDANWLLSTTVQSAAAFVAIVGGLLVSRLVALTTERSGLRVRRQEAAQLLDIANRRVAEAEDDLCELEADRAIDAEDDTIYAAHGDVDAEAVTQQSGWGAGDPAVVEKVAERLAHIRVAFAAVQRALGDNDPAQIDHDVIERAVDDELRPYVSDVLTQLADEQPRSRYDFLLHPPPRDSALIAGERQQRHREYERAVDAGLTARRHREDRATDLRLADEALARVGRPEGIGWGLVTLVYIAGTGIVLPLTVMLAGRTDTSLGVRSAVVGAFLSGLVAFGLYLRYVVRLASR